VQTVEPGAKAEVAKAAPVKDAKKQKVLLDMKRC
jgi:hypothetical protein